MKKSLLFLLFAVISLHFLGAATLNIPVSFNSDDVEEKLSDGIVMLYSTNLELVNHAALGDLITAVRFLNVGVPQGATITNAYIQFTVGSSQSGPVTLTIRGQDSDNPQWFDQSHYSVSTRPKTSASVSWAVPDTWNTVGDSGPDQRTPNLASIIQEIVDRPQWTSGNPMVLFVQGAGQGPNRRMAASHDSDPTKAPVLHIEYGGQAPFQARVMSFNTRWDGFNDSFGWPVRRERVYYVIDAFEPDTVGLQEPSQDAVDDIINALPYLDSYMYNNRTQPILWDTGRFNVDEYGGFMLYEGTSLSGSDRDCTWIHVVDPVSGKGYYHYNMHLDNRIPRGQELSVIRLVNAIAARSQNDPFVVTGDFNATENSNPMRFLRGEITLLDDVGAVVTNPFPMVDTFRVLYPNATNVGTAGGPSGNTSGNKIDYVMVEQGTTVLEAEINHWNDNGNYPSDHFPVTAVVEWE